MKTVCLSLAFAAMTLPLTSFAADTAAGQAIVSAQCGSCHGADGNSVGPQFPNLAGQNADYTVSQLKAFKSGVRKNDMMAPMVTSLSDEQMSDVAVFFSTQKAKSGSANAELVEQGKKLYQAGDAKNGISACMACHGPSGRGMAGSGFPALAGQHQEYIVAQLQAFKAGKRGGTEGLQAAMPETARKLSDEQMQAVASYIQGLKSE